MRHEEPQMRIPSSSKLNRKRGTPLPDEQVLSTAEPSLWCIFASLLLIFPFAKAQTAQNQRLLPLATIGQNSTSKNVPAAVVLDEEGNIYVAGTSEPFERNGQSDLPGADSNDLSSRDVYIARIGATSRSLDWIIRTGTSSDDIAEDLALHTATGSLYVVGRTSGQFGNTPRKGQHDSFILKYGLSGSAPPIRQWNGPVTFGSSSLDSATSVVLDASGGSVYVTGYTRGSLFRSKSTSDYDGFLAQFRTSDGNLERAVQFGEAENEYGRFVAFPPDSEGALLVGCDSSRRIGDIEVTNLKIYKFEKKTFSPRGSLLVKTFSRETASGLIRHPLFSETVFFPGTSWLEETNGFEFSLKRIENSFDNTSNIGEATVTIDDLNENKPQFSKKYGSRDQKADKCFKGKLSPGSGIIWLGGSTSGLIAAEAKKSSGSQIAFLAIDPNEGSNSLAIQQELPLSSSFSTLADFAFSTDSSYIAYAATRANETSGVLFSEIGTLQIPAALQEPVRAPSPIPKPSFAPSDSGSDRQNSETSNKTLFIAIGGGVAGAVLLIIIVCLACAICRIRTKSEDLKHGATKNRQGKQKETAQGRTRSPAGQKGSKDSSRKGNGERGKQKKESHLDSRAAAASPGSGGRVRPQLPPNARAPELPPSRLF